MKCWVVIYRHRHGTDAFPMFQEERPTEEEAQEATGCFEKEKEEDVEVTGPWEVPEC